MEWKGAAAFQHILPIFLRLDSVTLSEVLNLDVSNNLP